jgi:hypothetical protein
MAFCSHCGNAAHGGRFCSACGAPVAPDAVTVLTAELRRYHKKMRVVVAAAGLGLIAAGGLMLSRMSRIENEVTRPATRMPAVPPAAQAQPLPSPAVSRSPQSQTENGRTYSAPPPPVILQGDSLPAPARETGNINPQAVHSALKAMTERTPPEDSSEPSTAAPAIASSGLDRYPGSQPVEVKDVNVPDIGVPTSKEIYTTSDSVSTVIGYYRQRYPDAEVTEMEGQKIIAVDRPGATKVIAVGSNGSETRIAIVQVAGN